MAFSREELDKLDEYFKGKSTDMAYLLGRYSGLRINETFSLRWDHVDFEAGTITIDRQMSYQNGLFFSFFPAQNSCQSPVDSRRR